MAPAGKDMPQTTAAAHSRQEHATVGIKLTCTSNTLKQDACDTWQVGSITNCSSQPALTLASTV